MTWNTLDRNSLDRNSVNWNSVKAWTLQIGFALAMILTGYTWGHRSTAVVHAQSVAQGGITEVNMPRAWGPLIATMTGVFVFQDRSGAIRLVSAETGAVAEVVTRN
jgi:hypothetical protein